MRPPGRSLPRAQQKAMPVIGFLSSSGGRAQGFSKGLGETGYVVGQNVAIEYNLAQGHYDRLPAMAAELVGRKVDLIATLGPPAARAARGATSTIPIVFISGDPVAEGLVASLGHPSGNLTGLSIVTVELMPKRLEMLSELVPQTKVFALLVDPETPAAEAIIRHTEEAARQIGVKLHVLTARNTDTDEIDAAFARLLELHAGAHRRRHRLARHHSTGVSRGGGSASSRSDDVRFERSSRLVGRSDQQYGPNQEDVYRQMGNLRGGKFSTAPKPTDVCPLCSRPNGRVGDQT